MKGGVGLLEEEHVTLLSVSGGASLLGGTL